MQNRRLWKFPANCEFVLEGKITKEKATEGPFLDLTGIVDRERQQPIVEIKCITHRKNPIYQTILAGKNEHKFLMGMPKEPTIYNEVEQGLPMQRRLHNTWRMQLAPCSSANQKSRMLTTAKKQSPPHSKDTNH